VVGRRTFRQEYKEAFVLFNIYCFPTVTAVKLTHLSVKYTRTLPICSPFSSCTSLFSYIYNFYFYLRIISCFFVICQIPPLFSPFTSFSDIPIFLVFFFSYSSVELLGKLTCSWFLASHDYYVIWSYECLHYSRGHPCVLRVKVESSLLWRSSKQQRLKESCDYRESLSGETQASRGDWIHPSTVAQVFIIAVRFVSVATARIQNV
jgi:hypothetical protein